MAKTAEGAASVAETEHPLTTANPNQLPAPAAEADFDALMGEQAGEGFENVTARDLLIPRLTILQGLSPQVTVGHALYNEEARVGQIYDTAMGEVLGTEITIIPVHFAKVWLEWAPRASGKGLVNIHLTPKILESCVADEKNPLRMTTKEGNLIRETSQIFCLNVNSGFRKSFWGTSSTQLKKTKRLITLAEGERVRSGGRDVNPPLYYRSYKLGTVPESNSQGNWVGWTVDRGPRLDEFANWRELMGEIRLFREGVASGTLKADVESMAEEEQRATGEEAPF